MKKSWLTAIITGKKNSQGTCICLSLASDGDYFSITLLFCFLTPSYKQSLFVKGNAEKIAYPSQYL